MWKSIVNTARGVIMDAVPAQPAASGSVPITTDPVAPDGEVAPAAVIERRQRCRGAP